MAKRPVKLKRVLDKTEFALTAVDASAEKVRFEAGLWFHVVGLLNAFYAIRDELGKTTQNDPDPLLKEAVKQWRGTNAQKLDTFFGEARNKATHQGAVFIDPHIEWVVDELNDTEHPRNRARLTVDGTSIKDMPETEFLDLCRRSFEFLRQGILDINADYVGRGGVHNALPEQSEDYAFLDDGS